MIPLHIMNKMQRLHHQDCIKMEYQFYNPNASNIIKSRSARLKVPFQVKMTEHIF